MIKPPEYIAAIKPYVPGKPVEELERELGISGSIKLASNENPIGPSPKAVEAIKEIGKDLNRYPDGSAYYLKNRLSEGLSVSPDEIILGNGSNELLDIAVRTYMQPGDEAVMAHPSFVVYFLATQSIGARSVQVSLKDYRHDLDAMLNAVTGRTKVVFIANPNNPTGTINKKDEFDRFMERLPENILVVVDEAYFEYVSDKEYADSMKWFRSGRDILILRTFSKIYGLAGLRIGYGIAKTGIAVEMNKIRAPFNTSTMAQAAALGALNDDEHVRRSRAVNEEGKTYLYDELINLGLEYVRTEANFIYMPVEDSALLYEKLLMKGVIIRPMGPKAVRVTIGLPDENKRFIEAIKGVMRDA